MKNNTAAEFKWLLHLYLLLISPEWRFQQRQLLSSPIKQEMLNWPLTLKISAHIEFLIEQNSYKILQKYLLHKGNVKIKWKNITEKFPTKKNCRIRKDKQEIKESDAQRNYEKKAKW